MDVRNEDLGIDLESVMQAAFPKTQGTPTSALMPHAVVEAPDPDDPTGMGTVAREVEIAYREEVRVRPDSNEMTVNRWVLLFADDLQPRGYQTTGSRRWATPLEQELVDAGMAFLDERRWPKPWWTLVDPDDLVMSSPCGCVLGQLDDPDGHGDYYEMAERLDLTPEQRVEFGFTSSGAPFVLLDTLWRAAIRRRRAGRP